MPEGTRTNSREAERFFLSEEQPTGAASIVPDDGHIRDEVAQNLARDPWVNDRAVMIDVREGVVTLEGQVDVTNQKLAAGEDAWNAPGVKDVRNDLTVRKPEGLDRRERIALHPEATPPSGRRRR